MEELTEEFTEELIEVADCGGLQINNGKEMVEENRNGNNSGKQQWKTAVDPLPLEGQLALGLRNFKG